MTNAEAFVFSDPGTGDRMSGSEIPCGLYWRSGVSLASAVASAVPDKGGMEAGKGLKTIDLICGDV